MPPDPGTRTRTSDTGNNRIKEPPAGEKRSPQRNAVPQRSDAANPIAEPEADATRKEVTLVWLWS
jgi:hypothetical protein